MLYRVLGIACVALALTLLVGGSTLVAGEKGTAGKDGVGKTGEKGYDVTIVKVGKHELTVEGKDGKEHKHAVAKDAKITVDGKKADLDDLKAGEHAHVMVSGGEFTSVAVTTKGGGSTTKEKAPSKDTK